MRPPDGHLKVVFWPSPHCFLQVFILRGLERHFAEVQILKGIAGGVGGGSRMGSSYMLPPGGASFPQTNENTRFARSMVLMVLAKVLQRWDLQMGFGAVGRARAGKLVTPSPPGIDWGSG